MPRTLPCASSAICAAAFRGLRYPGVREVEHEGAERLRPEDARRMGDEAEAIFPTRERLSLLQYQLPADRDDHRKHHQRQRWKPDPQTAVGTIRINTDLLSRNRSHAEPVGARLPPR